MSRPDAIVIGAGIAGAFCALELARAGLRVEILEARTPAAGATSEGMGHVVVMDDSEAQLALTAWSRSLWHQWAAEYPETCELSSRGTLWLAEDEDDIAAIASKAERLNESGISYEELGPEALRRLEPQLNPGLTGALRVPDDVVTYPPAVASRLLELAGREYGARLRLGVEVRRLGGGREGQPVRITLAGGERLEADWAVDAAGGRALEILPETMRRRHLPGVALAPRKGHLLITERRPGFCHHQLVEMGYLKSAHGHQNESVAFNLQPRENGQLLLGSSRQYGQTSRQVDARIVRRMAERARDFVPSLGRLPILRAWTGFRAATADHLPILGPIPEHPRLMLSAGHEGLGITNAPASARLIAAQVLERPTVLSTHPYRADRPGLVHG